jgi:sec-independent protein translocase protein TatC
MAVTTQRRRARDPEGRMPLREHLRELRRRIIVSVLAIAVAGTVGWFLYEPLFNAVQEPLREARQHLVWSISRSAAPSTSRSRCRFPGGG